MHDLLLGVVTADVPLTRENVRPGWLAMLLVGVLALALFLLVRSFLKHTRRAAKPWPGEKDDDEDASS